MRKLLAFSAAFAAVLGANAAVELSGVNAQGGFAGIENVVNAKMQRTAGALVFSDIQYDMQVVCRLKPFRTMDADRFEFEYRATGPASQKGGEVFYALGPGGGFTGERLWRLPPLVRDGKWHVLSVGRKAIANPADWDRAGTVERIRFDPTDQDGGTLEIRWFRFAQDIVEAEEKKVPETPVDPDVAQSLDQDAWPNATVKVWSDDPVPESSSVRVVAECFGGTAEPSVATAGERIRLRYDFRGKAPKQSDVLDLNLSILDGQVLRWDERIQLECRTAVRHLGGNAWRLEFDYDLPLYIDSGKLEIRIESPAFCYVVGSAYPVARLSLNRIGVAPGWEKPLRSGVAKVADSTYFSVNGKPVSALWGAVHWARRRDQLPRHSSAPLNVVTLWHTDVRKWWPKGEDFVPAELDRIAEKVRRSNPEDAYFMADLSVYPPADWAEANPDEMSCDEHGKIPADGGPSRPNFSFASEKTIALMERKVVQAIRHIENSPYANRVIGYRVNSGHTIEWLGWETKNRDDVQDFSPASRRAFEAFARKNYPEITDFSIPTFAERCAADTDGLFLDRRRHARIIAYHDFHSTSIAEDAIRLCGAAKEATGGRKVVGTYYGYVMTLGISQMQGHFALKRLLDSGKVDFLMSPPWYSWCSRGPGSTLADMKPFTSIANHGMVSVVEDDTRTHNMRYDSRVGLQQALNEPMSVGYMRRNMGIALCRNLPFYTLALTSGAEFDFPRFAEDACAYRRVAEHALAKETRRAAEVAVVVSEDAVKGFPLIRKKGEQYARGHQWYLGDGSVLRKKGSGCLPACVAAQFYTDCARIGCGVDYLLAEDLDDNPGDYRLYVMACCSKSSPALLRAAERLRARNCSILWTYAPGYVSDDGNSLENMKALTGLEFAKREGLSDPGITLEDGSRIGPVKSDAGLFFALKSADRVFGRYDNGDVAFGERRTGPSTSVFSSTHLPGAQVLKALAKSAGVHLYSETLDPVEANERFVTLHARTAGRKTIALPRKTDVVDVFNRRLVARGVSEFSFDAELHSSWLFYCADDAADVLRGL